MAARSVPRETFSNNLQPQGGTVKSIRWLVAVLSVVALVAAACGDDEEPAAPATGAADVAEAQQAAAAAQAAEEEALAAASAAEERLAAAEAAAAAAGEEMQAEAQAELEAARAEAAAAQEAAAAAAEEAAMATEQAAAAAEEAAMATEQAAMAEAALAEAAMIATDHGVDVENRVIRVGVNTDLSGAFAPLTTKITDGHLAYWQWINDNGGIQGWTIEPVVIDNAYNVPTHLENYEVMAGDGPQSVVMFSTSTGSPHTASTAELLIEDNLAAIPLSWYSGWADPEIGRNVFEVQTNYCIEAMNGATYMAETYGPNVAIASFPGDYGEDGAEGIKVAAEALGLNIAYDGQAQVVPGGDLTPVIAGIAESGADWVWLTTNPTTTAQLIGGAAQAGFSGQWSGNSPSWNPALLGTGIAELADATYTHSSYMVLWGVGEAEGMQEMISVMQEYRPDAPFDDVYAISFIEGYVATQILDAAISSGDLTRAGVLAAANSITADLKGLAPDQSWSGNPDHNVVRGTYLYDVDLSLYTPGATVSTPDGNNGFSLIKGPYVSETAANWQYEPCFKAS
ncbi:MAG: ABC transporter substrate-binding protein [Acidimicrobiaceae bacterium]|nr:ABC transporter substrate-binding protein [Acidimicrobiaceae bacterium]MYA00057.1 ABC transporter substrate-binding protein [Acidimicrobiaceae bacterium]MYE75125.1 ABC transporter substrate-binding protein [Acidimicrobiaceae bacterium]MYE96266.1 ABC transporter substrate-binding protein [Acidimicrobiaceae bacterium]MYI54251.1 ABC transporter substrate-binding protein [Acidimicrobiaceae bacterium]